MDPKLYMTYRLRKQAGLESLIKTVVDAAKEGGKFVLDNFITSAKVSLPAMSLTGAWLLYKAMSPEAVADVAPQYAINANEAESVMQSMRDLEEMQLRKKLDAGKRKVHDRFL